MNTHHVRRQLQRLVCKPLSERRFLHYTDISHSTLNLPRKKQNGWLKGKRGGGKGVCLRGRCCEGGSVTRLLATTDPERDLERPWRALLSFSLSNHLIPGFSGHRPKKKTKAIISIQFAPSLHMNTDRLSYFGHAPSRGCERQEGR